MAAENPSSLAVAANLPGVRAAEADLGPSRRRLHLDGDHRVPEVITALVANGVRVTRAEPLEPSLATYSGVALGVVAWIVAIVGLSRGMRAVSRSRLLGVNDGV
ncbi:hypothetical protein BH23ACT2_BH23ACT2_04260 [soil metagenome]